MVELWTNKTFKGRHLGLLINMFHYFLSFFWTTHKIITILEVQ